MKEMKEMKQDEFPCVSCANAGTVICRLCVATESPSGKVTRPSQYLRTVPREEVLVQDREPAEGVADCAAEMLAYLVAEKPIPLATVMRWNDETQI